MIQQPAYPSKSESVSVKENVRVRQDLLIGAGLFLFTLVSRLPFTGEILYHWDSINFAMALEKFDVGLAQPHIPGYILYVFLGKLVNGLVGDHQQTLAGISMIGSGLAVAALYLLGKELYDRRIGLIAALFMAASPLFWFYGEIALPHTLDTFMVIILVWMFYKLAKGEHKLILPAAILLGLAGGFRPQTQFFLMPLALFAAYRSGWRQSLIGLATLILVNLAWLIPLLSLNGGLTRYLVIMNDFSDAFNTTTAIFTGGLPGLIRNARKLTMYTLYGWGFALIPIAVISPLLLYRFMRGLRRDGGRNILIGGRAFLRDDRSWLFLLWIIPTTIYYVFIHMGQQGLVFVFLPALLLLSAAVIFTLHGNVIPYRTAGIAALLTANCAIFLFAPTYPLGGERLKLLTADTLRLHDEDYQARFSIIRENFSKEHTIVLSNTWRFIQYYLPEYTLLPYDISSRWEVDEGATSLSDEAEEAVVSMGMEMGNDGYYRIEPSNLGLSPDAAGFYYLVLFNQQLAQIDESNDLQETLNLPNGDQIVFTLISPQDRLFLGPESFGVRKGPTGESQ